jgi:uncharacterized membrane protein
VNGFERVGCVGKAVDAVSGARISTFISCVIDLQRNRHTLYLNVGIWIQLCGRGLGFVYALLVLIVTVYFISFLVD